MAIQKQLVPLNISQGIDTKSDDKSLPLGKLVNLENMKYDELNKIKKKFGSTTLGTTVLNSGTAISDPLRLVTYKDEIILITKTNIYSYSESQSGWIDKGNFSGISISSEQIFANIESQATPQAAKIGNLILYAWSEGTTIRYSILDYTTGAYIKRDETLASTSYQVKVLEDGATFYMFYCEGIGNTLKCSYIAASDPYTVTTQLNLVSGISSSSGNYVFNITKASDDYFAVTYRKTIGGKPWADWYDTSLKSMFIGQEVNEACGGALSATLKFDGNGDPSHIIVFYQNASNQLRASIYEPGGSETQYTVSSPSNTITNIVIYNDATTVSLFYEVAAAASYNTLTQFNTFTLAGTAGTAGSFMYSCGIASEPFIGPDGEIYIVLVHDSELQPTYFLTKFIDKDTPFICGAFAKDIAGGLTDSQNVYSPITQVDSNTFVFPNIKKTKLTSEDGEILAIDTVQATTFDFNNRNSISTVEIGNNLLISGGCPYIYDGSSVVEAGFHLYPENLSNNTPVSASPAPGAGDYLYKCVYEWYDTKGQVHRSAPSAPLGPITLAGGEQVTIICPTLRITERDRANNSDISVVFYRTKASGSVYYRLSSVTDPTTNNRKANSVSIVDQYTDADISSNEILYTQGGVLENINIGPANVVGEYKNRAVFVSLEDQAEVRYSKEQVTGEALQFNPLLGFRIDDANKAVSAIAELDQYMVLFTSTDIYIQAGQGPTDSGALNDFQTPQRVASDVGCPYPQSVVTMPMGVMFKSKKGFYLLDRALNTTYIGAPVEDYNTLSVTGAVLIRDENTVRFTHSDGSCLVYDYIVGQWSIYTGYSSIACCLWQDSFCYVDSTGEVFKESSATYLVDSAAILGKIKTGWIKLAGLKGFQRLYSILFTGKYYSAHGLTVKLYYDYSTTATDEYTYTASSDFDFEVRPTQQKCEAIQIEIIEINSVPTDGASFDLSGITLVTGIKPNAFRIKPTKRVDAN